MSDDSELKARLLADVRAHLLVHGPKRWELVRDKYPEVNERKFFRWTKELREGGTQRGTERLTKRHDGPVAAAEGAHAEVMEEAANRARLAAIKNIPAAPSPDYMARAGIRAEEQINFLAEITLLYRDSQKLRSYSVKKDETAEGGEKLVNPTMFGASIEKRLKVIDTAVRIMQEVWDLQYMQRFFDAIIDIIVEEIGPADPELQARILERLKELNERRGMTQYAGMG